MSSDKSDDSSFLSSSSYVSSFSDLSECEDNKKSKTTRSRRGSSGVNSDIIREMADEHNSGSGEQSEVHYSRAEDHLMGMGPDEFIREHEHLINEEEIIKKEEDFEQELFNGMMYEDTPVMARILAPSMHFDDADF